jgi:hypothetical protein
MGKTIQKPKRARQPYCELLSGRKVWGKPKVCG